MLCGERKIEQLNEGMQGKAEANKERSKEKRREREGKEKRKRRVKQGEYEILERWCHASQCVKSK